MSGEEFRQWWLTLAIIGSCDETFQNGFATFESCGYCLRSRGYSFKSYGYSFRSCGDTLGNELRYPSCASTA